MFARLCGLAEPLSPLCCSLLLRAITILFDGSPPLPSVAARWDVAVPLHKATEAIKIIAATTMNSDVLVALARLAGFAIFPLLTVSIDGQLGNASVLNIGSQNYYWQLIFGFPVESCIIRANISSSAARC
jgi:hypothetical protein